jgi:hypothetical protein
LARKFDKLAVNLAGNQKKRRPLQIMRPRVWCSGKAGHYPAKCQEDLHYVEDYAEDVHWTDEIEELQWRIVQAQKPHHPPQPMSRPQGIGRGRGPMGTKPIPRPPMHPPGGYPDLQKPRVKVLVITVEIRGIFHLTVHGQKLQGQCPSFVEIVEEKDTPLWSVTIRLHPRCW